MEYHVSKSGNDQFSGTENEPFLTISRAALLAGPGDTVNVHKGIYREWVSPENSGTEEQRIVYQAAGDGEVVITGAEPVIDWKEEGDGIWGVTVPGTLFTVRNPFKEELYGDWLFEGAFKPHLGDVYLNGKSLYECDSKEKLKNPQIWPQAKYGDDSLLLWYAEVNGNTTKIWANFGIINGTTSARYFSYAPSCSKPVDPRTENVEINVRPYCFWPKETGKNYITVRGFTLCQASPQWAPPTALQEGLIGPHWSKGWIIEDNIIRESKCTGISLGKEISTGHNEWSNSASPEFNGFKKGGTQREQEVIFRALRSRATEGACSETSGSRNEASVKNWSKENIGSHIVRYNIIHDCERAGIVGHLGGAFSQIYNNKIYNIHHKRLFHGAEVAGIKLHASLDTQICNNKIFSCYRALWLDWQAQGTRISKNIFFDNLSEDFFVEVCHGPYTVDHNLFLSPMNFRNMAQGGAFVHNLFAGRFITQSELTRYTPYHFPHETDVAGYSNFSGGDDRFINNVFLGDNPADVVREAGDLNNEKIPMTFFEHLPLTPRKGDEGETAAVIDGVPVNSRCYLLPVGLSGYDNYPEKFLKMPWEFSKEEKEEVLKKYGSLYKLGRWAIPVIIKNNLYLNNAFPCSHETDAKAYSEKGVEIEISFSQKKVNIRVIDQNIFKHSASAQGVIVTSEMLGKSFHAEMSYEHPDGTPYIFNKDFFGNERISNNVTPGPFEFNANQQKEFVIDI